MFVFPRINPWAIFVTRRIKSKRLLDQSAEADAFIRFTKCSNQERIRMVQWLNKIVDNEKEFFVVAKINAEMRSLLEC